MDLEVGGLRDTRFVIDYSAGTKASGEYNVYLREVWLDHGWVHPINLSFLQMGAPINCW